MSRRVYISSFLVAAFLFVPVYFHYFFGSLMTPGWAQLAMIWGMTDLDWQMDLAIAVQLLFYSLIFIFCARKTFQLSERFSASWRLVFHVVILSAVFCASFLKVNFATAFVNVSDTATVWGILPRFLGSRSDGK